MNVRVNRYKKLVLGNAKASTKGGERRKACIERTIKALPSNMPVRRIEASWDGGDSSYVQASLNYGDKCTKAERRQGRKVLKGTSSREDKQLALLAWAQEYAELLPPLPVVLSRGRESRIRLAEHDPVNGETEAVPIHPVYVRISTDRAAAETADVCWHWYTRAKGMTMSVLVDASQSKELARYRTVMCKDGYSVKESHLQTQIHSPRLIMGYAGPGDIRSLTSYWEEGSSPNAPFTTNPETTIYVGVACR